MPDWLDRAGLRRRSKPLALLACLAFAALALASGFDREALLKPALAARLPSALADAALATRGQADLSARRYRAALADGEAAVRRAPLEPVSTALLGAARLGLGDHKGAHSAFLIAGQLGWRTPLTQAYWMNQALAVKDFPVAALRLDALLRQQPWLVGEDELLAPFEREPPAREALVARLIAAPSWLETYASEATALDPQALARRATVLEDLAAAGMRLDCGAIALPVNRLAQAGLMAEAQRLWRAQCPSATAGAISDPGLNGAQGAGARSLFEWDLIGNSDVSLSLVPSDRAGERLLAVRNEGAFARQVLRQVVIATPGDYRLRWRAAVDSDPGERRADAAWGCSPDSVTPLAATRESDGQTWSARLSVSGDCPGHWLVFIVQPGGGEVRIGHVSMDRL